MKVINNVDIWIFKDVDGKTRFAYGLADEPPSHISKPMKSISEIYNQIYRDTNWTINQVGIAPYDFIKEQLD